MKKEQNLENRTEQALTIPVVMASVCGYCGRLLGDDNYPKPLIQGLDFEMPKNAIKVEGSCCIAKDRLGAF
jgi:hypothetical protein